MNEHGWTPSEQLAVCQKEKNVAPTKRRTRYTECLIAISHFNVQIRYKGFPVELIHKTTAISAVISKRQQLEFNVKLS